MKKQIGCVLAAVAIGIVALEPSKACAGWGWWGGPGVGFSITVGPRYRYYRPYNYYRPYYGYPRYAYRPYYRPYAYRPYYGRPYVRRYAYRKWRRRW
jgi:hypothetical protein